jgi:hypothetical protein
MRIGLGDEVIHYVGQQLGSDDIAFPLVNGSRFD